MDHLNMTPEMLAKMKSATSAEELMTLAKAYGIELDAPAAGALFSALHERTGSELTEADLEKVAGGSIERPDIPGSQQSGC